MGSKPKSPPPPDTVGAAKATAQGNKEAAMYTTALDRPTQVDPYGQTSWKFVGKDIKNPKPGDWVQTTSLTGLEQDIMSQEQKNRLALENLAGTGTGIAQETLSTKFNPQNLPALYDPSQFTANGGNVREALYRQMTRFADERLGRQEESERARLANMGFAPGSEGYDRAMREFNRNRNEVYDTAGLSATLAAGQEESRQLSDFLQKAGLAASSRSQGFQEEAFKRGLPLNEISALMSGSPVNLPQFSPFAQSQPFQGPDLLSAELGRYNAQLGAANAQNAATGNTYSLVGGLAGAAATAW